MGIISRAEVGAGLRKLSWWRAGLVALAGAAMAFTGIAGAAGHQASSPGGPTASPLTAAQGVEVTLLTGDTVTWVDSGDGRRTYTVDAATRDGRRPVTFLAEGTDEDFYVYPSDTLEYVAAGVLDEELFNIPSLVEQGLDDASVDSLPVIVTFEGSPAPAKVARDADALPGSRRATAPLASLKGAGMRVNRAKAADFWNALVPETPGAGAPGRRRAPGGVDRLERGVAQVLLDVTVEVDLDVSVPQIGARTAWEAGLSGDGVTVAVLDTGIDASHPDLAGKVIAAANFTADPPTDGNGHGTHVASTIAGTGAASGGRYTGVAPGASLLSGKVCSNRGTCESSSVIAGMEWATGQGADIVNMSLGGEPTDGTDPMSQALNTLSAETDTLFVVSAGNSGGFQRVGTPGAADAALTVGAVTKTNVLASFSSRGPRLNDYAVKPNITAPGVAIVAARATGTFVGRPVNDRYTSLSGTSMAAPHVAGAAALLAQARPELDGEALKDALTSTAANGGYTWFEQGTGRVDVAAAVSQGVYASASVDFGDLDAPAERNVAYTNYSDGAVTLQLSTSVTKRNGRAAGGLSLSTSTVTVPARGSARVTVAVDPKVSGPGIFGGVLAATGPGVSLRTAIGFGKVGRNLVTVRALDSAGNRIGTPSAPDWFVTLIQDTFDPANPLGQVVYQGLTADGVATAQVPTGTYTVMMHLLERDPATGTHTRLSQIIVQEVRIESDVTVTLDARTAVETKATAPRVTVARMHRANLIRGLATGATFTLSGGVSWSPPIYVSPAPPGKLAFTALWDHWTLTEPQPLRPLPWRTASSCERLQEACYSEAPAYIYNLPLYYPNGVPDTLHRRVTYPELVEVPTRYQADNPDAFIEHSFFALPPYRAGVGSAQMFIRPGKVTEYFLADDRTTWARFAGPQFRDPRPRGLNMWSNDRFLVVEGGTRRPEERWFEAPLRVGQPDLRDEALGGPLPAFGAERDAYGSRGGAEGDQFLPGRFVLDNSRGHLATAAGFASWRLWNLDTGAELAGIGGRFALSPAAATYRLEQVDTIPAAYAPLFRTKPTGTTSWTFLSARSDAEVPAGYQCPIRQAPRAAICQIQPLIQLRYALGLDINNRAPAGSTHVFTIEAGHHSKAVDRAPVTAMTVEASFDDGATWEAAKVSRLPTDDGTFQTFRVSVNHPKLEATNGYVTLRVRAEDGNGGTIEQVSKRAYILR